MTDTFKILKDSGIEYIGAGNNFSEARAAKIIKKNGVRFGFLAYAYPTDLYLASSSTPGMANMDIEAMKKDIAELKKSADVAVVEMHAGAEYTNLPNSQQKNFARAAIDAGADLVVGHHPHWVQITEVYKDKPILYSLGNLVFDQMWSMETRQGAIAVATFKDKKLAGFKIIPIRIDDYGQAVIMNDAAEIKAVLRRMKTTEEIKIVN